MGEEEGRRDRREEERNSAGKNKKKYYFWWQAAVYRMKWCLLFGWLGIFPKQRLCTRKAPAHITEQMRVHACMHTHTLTETT